MKLLLFLVAILACNQSINTTPKTTGSESAKTNLDSLVIPAIFQADGGIQKLTRSDAEWKSLLPELDYYVLREEGTERAFAGSLWNNHESGIYICKGCKLPLFDSSTKFDSGTGWPSFFQPIDPRHVKENSDKSHFMERVEVECARCGGHQGHVFEDGPRPTGLRYCINSVSLIFVANTKK